MKEKFLINKKIRNPFFSIITVVKNSEKEVTKTIKSLIKQSFRNFEYIIIDGLSKDKTLSKILKNKKHITKLLSEKDEGIYFAMNKGLNLAKGEIVVFVNAGDTLTKHGLKKIFEIFDKNKKIDFVFGTVMRHYTKDKILKHGFNINRLKYNFDFATSHSTGFYIKRRKFIQVGKFNTSYKCSSDYDLYYKAIIKHKLKGGYTKKKDLIGIVSKGGFSSTYSYLDHLKEEMRIRFNNNQSIFIILLIAINSIFKNFFKIIKNK